MSFSVVSTKDAPAAIGPYSQGIRVPPFLFVSGCVPLDPATGNVVGGSDIEAQARQALKNLSAVIKAGGSQVSRVVKTTVFMKDMNDFQKVNAIYADFFGDHKPARSAVEVSIARLPKDVLFEIEAIATIDN
ncbi:YjgF-like protein [Hysterangium stoloniferum]|nr:YjgF-like protein [Hysterangium stoloniferum]